VKRIIFIFICSLSLMVSLTSAQDDPLATMQNFANYVAQIADAPTTDAQTMVDGFWTQLTENQFIPFVRGGDVAFLYRGESQTVDWRGDFNGWSATSDFAGERIGETDLWVVYAQFPSDARLDYKIVLNGSTWILDPYNPNQQMGGFGANSELRMADYSPSPFIVRDETAPQGRVRGAYRLQSEALGYAVNYSVYLPAGYADLDALPTIYVLDGHEYINDDMGSMVIVLDNLIAQQLISPVIAVFIDPRDPNNPSNNRRQTEYIENSAFAEFVAEELVLNIDRVFKTAETAQSRAILGTSLGGLASAYIAVNYPDVFHNVAIQSPAFWISSELYGLYEQSDDLDLFMIITNGTPEWDADDIPNFTTILDDLSIQYGYVEVNEGHSWGNWRSLIDDILIYFWSMA